MTTLVEVFNLLKQELGGGEEAIELLKKRALPTIDELVVNIKKTALFCKEIALKVHIENVATLKKEYGEAKNITAYDKYLDARENARAFGVPKEKLGTRAKAPMVAGVLPPAVTTAVALNPKWTPAMENAYTCRTRYSMLGTYNFKKNQSRNSISDDLGKAFTKLTENEKTIVLKKFAANF